MLICSSFSRNNVYKKTQFSKWHLLERILWRWILMQHELKRLCSAASTARFFKIDVLIFERSREIDWKKIDQPRIELVSQQNKLGCGPFSTLSACANEVTVRELHNYIHNKTTGKYHASVTSSFSKTKVSFVFRSTRDLQKTPLQNWVFCTRYFSKTKGKSTKTIMQWCVSCQNNSVCQN